VEVRWGGSEVTPSEAADHLEITRQIYRYARAIDTRDWNLLEKLFTKDAVIDYRVPGGTRLELPAMVEWLRASLRIFRTTQHVMSNPLVEIAGDEARSTTYLTATHVQVGLDGEQSVATLHGIYRDAHVRSPDGWRIRERILEPVHAAGRFLGPDEIK
jgi:hypothetical protein